MSRSHTLREAILERTGSAHRALGALPLMGAVSGGSPSDDEYRDYLAAHLRLHAPLEAALRPWVPTGWLAVRLIKSQWLEDDLAVLDGERQDVDARPVDITSEAQALGALYVLEGATLGLQVVRRRIGTCAPKRGAASRFLLGYGEATGANWREFVARLDALPSSGWPQALDAAGSTFAAFQRGFAPPSRGAAAQ